MAFIHISFLPISHFRSLLGERDEKGSTNYEAHKIRYKKVIGAFLVQIIDRFFFYQQS